MTDIICELKELLSEKSEWVEAGVSIVDESVYSAIKFYGLISKIDSIPKPHVVIGGDGLAGLEWRFKGGIFDLSFDFEGLVTWATYFVGHATAKGRFTFDKILN